MEKRKLTITLQADWKSAIRSVGITPQQDSYQGETLNFQTPGAFFSRLTERRWVIIKTLQQKKCRIQNGLFVVEGIKTVQELLDSDFKAYEIFSTKAGVLQSRSQSIKIISETELKRMSSLQKPNIALGVFHTPTTRDIADTGWSLMLDDVRDPGNLGTIIRLCDWYGIKHLICSLNTVDCYNPKVLQATMGSITRVQVDYLDATDYLTQTKRVVYGAFMDGADMREQDFPSEGILVMGNEANGISDRIQAMIRTKVAIPQFGKKTAESLNVAMATAILLSEVHRT